MKGNEFNLSPREWRSKNKINEAYADGTVSPDEDRKMSKLLDKLEKEISTFNNKVQRMYAEADKIGGSFRGPGYSKQLDDILFGPRGAGKNRHPKMR